MDAEMMGAAIRDFYTGKSYKQIAEGLKDEYDIPEPSKATIYEWVKDYTDEAKEQTADLKAEVGDEWAADEIAVKVWQLAVLELEHHGYQDSLHPRFSLVPPPHGEGRHARQVSRADIIAQQQYAGAVAGYIPESDKDPAGIGQLGIRPALP